MPQEPKKGKHSKRPEETRTTFKAQRCPRAEVEEGGQGAETLP